MASAATKPLEAQTAQDDIILDVQGLKKYFRVGRGLVLKAVDDLTFKVKRGETMGLVGESGCGKSTTGRTIIRLYDPTGGRVFFNGEDVTKLEGA